MHAIAHQDVQTPYESCLWEKNPWPHRGIEPASASCWSNALPTELHPHSAVLAQVYYLNSSSGHWSGAVVHDSSTSHSWLQQWSLIWCCLTWHVYSSTYHSWHQQWSLIWCCLTWQLYFSLLTPTVVTDLVLSYVTCLQLYFSLLTPAVVTDLALSYVTHVYSSTSHSWLQQWSLIWRCLTQHMSSALLLTPDSSSGHWSGAVLRDTCLQLCFSILTQAVVTDLALSYTTQVYSLTSHSWLQQWSLIWRCLTQHMSTALLLAYGHLTTAVAWHCLAYMCLQLELAPAL